MSVYQVVAECAHATMNHPLYGRTQQLLLKGALVPEDAPELEHLLSIGSVVETGDEATGGLNADGVPSGVLDGGVQVPSGVTTTPVAKSPEQLQAEREAAEKAKADADLAEKRQAAQAKLPEGGAMPDGRASQAVWVEYLVSKGSRYEDVASADKDELIKLAKQQS